MANNEVVLYEFASNKSFKYTREEFMMMLKYRKDFEDIYKRFSKSFDKLAKY